MRGKIKEYICSQQFRFGVKHNVNFTTPGRFIRLSNIKHHMKSISELVIGKP